MIKLAYVPPAPDGVTLYAILAAASRLSPEPRFITRILGPGAVSARPLWPRGLGAISDTLPPTLGMTPLRLLQRHTLAPAFLPFMTPERRDGLIRSLLQLDAGEPAQRSGSSACPITLAVSLLACPKCLGKGIYWWQCHHQLPGCLVCADHPDLLLHNTDVLRSPREDRTRHIDLRDARLLGPSATGLSPQGMQHAADFSIALRSLLRDAVPHPGPEKFRQWMRERLRERGYARPFGKVDLQGCVAAFRNWIGTDFARGTGLPLPRRANDGNWLVELLTTRRTAIHPTFAVACSLFAGVDIRSALVAADALKPQRLLSTKPMRRGISPAHARFERCKGQLRRLWGQSNLSVWAIGRRLQVRDNTVARWAATLGLPFPRQGPTKVVHAPARRGTLPSFADRVREHRHRWLEALRRFPCSEVSVVRHPTTRALYAWLWRYDPKWLLRHRPKRSRRSVVNWAQRDRELSKRIVTVAAALRARAVPTRASRTRIIAILRAEALFRSPSRLPKARTALTRHAESHREFVPRRLRALFAAGKLSHRALTTAFRKQPALRRHPLLQKLYPFL